MKSHRQPRAYVVEAGMQATTITLMQRAGVFRWQRSDGEWVGPEHGSEQEAMQFAWDNPMITGSEIAAFMGRMHANKLATL